MKQLERVERGTKGEHLIRRAMLGPSRQAGMSHRPFLASLASCPSLFLHALPHIANSVASEP